MYSQSKEKQLNVVAGVSGSFLYEIDSGEMARKDWECEWKDSDFTEGYDQVFAKDWTQRLNSARGIMSVRENLLELNLEANYHLVKLELEKHNISCGGYNNSGRLLHVYNSVAQLTVDCSKPIGPQLERFAKLYA